MATCTKCGTETDWKPNICEDCEDLAEQIEESWRVAWRRHDELLNVATGHTEADGPVEGPGGFPRWPDKPSTPEE